MEREDLLDLGVGLLLELEVICYPYKLILLLQDCDHYHYHYFVAIFAVKASVMNHISYLRREWEQSLGDPRSDSWFPESAPPRCHCG